MDSHIKVQKDLNFRIKRALENFKKSPKERRFSVEYLTTRLDLLEELWTQFSNTHTQLIQDSDADKLIESSYMVNDVYEETEEVYIDYRCLVKSILNQVKPIKQGNGAADTIDSCKVSNRSDELIRLPKISIPVFSGKYSEWVSFRDLFISLIHKNKSLDDVQKLHYLKGHLIGEAEQLLRHVPITQENYSTSWEQLESRYNNKKYLSNCILKRLFSQRNLATESSNALKELLDTTNECLQALKNLGIDIKSWDIIIVHIICLKLDSESRKQWELKSSESGNELPTYEELKKFLETRFRALEFIDPKLSRPTHNPNNSSNVPVHAKVNHVSAISCAFCSQAHKISNCKDFAKIETDARRDFVKSHSLCFNCLALNHSVYSCRRSDRCRICKRKHHSLLHPKNVVPATESQESNHSIVANVVVPATASHSSSYDEFTTNIKTHFSTSRSQVLLATALVNATSKSGNSTTLRFLLDQGSQASLITESAVQLLGLKKIAHKGTISRLGSDKSAKIASKSIVQLRIQSLHDASFELEVNAFVLSKLTSVLPERKSVVESWSKFADLNLADPTFNQPNRVDLLLGADVFSKILLEGVRKGSPGAPIAQNTSLGWILWGPIQMVESTLNNSVRVNHVSVSDNELLKGFGELEADSCVMSPKNDCTEEKRGCEEIDAATTKRVNSGKYNVKPPFRDPNSSCKESRVDLVTAISNGQLESGIKKDHGDPSHMEVVPKEEQGKTGSFDLPHHAVIREEETMSKLRVDFDASCSKTNGVCSNQDLLVSLQLDNIQVDKFSSLRPLVSDVARFVKQMQSKTLDWLIVKEIEANLATCIEIVQSSSLEPENKTLKKENNISRSRKLTSTNPVIDDVEILKVGGRLKDAGINVLEVSSNISKLRKWQQTPKLLENLWYRWSSEYVMKFYHRHRYKHVYETPEPSIGNV